MSIMVVCSKCNKHYMIEFTGANEELGAFLREYKFVCEECKEEQ